MTTLVPELLRLPVNPSIESDDAELLPSVGRVGRSDDFMGEGPFAISNGVGSSGGGALRLVMVRLEDGPGPASARGVVSSTVALVLVVLGVVLIAVTVAGDPCSPCCVGGGGSLKKFMGLNEDVIPLRLISGRLLNIGMVDKRS